MSSRREPAPGRFAIEEHGDTIAALIPGLPLQEVRC